MKGISVFMLQWQAGSKQHTTPAGFEPDKTSWGWNWLERWMAVRPWENRFLDMNIRDGVKIHDNGSGDLKNGSNNQMKSISKKPISSIISNEKMVPPHSSTNSKLSNGKMVGSQSNGSSSSPNKSVNTQETTLSGPPNSKSNMEGLVEEASSRPTLGSRSHSNPKERTTLSDKQGKRRLSLPNSGQCFFVCFSVHINFYFYCEAKLLRHPPPKSPLLPQFYFETFDNFVYCRFLNRDQIVFVQSCIVV